MDLEPPQIPWLAPGVARVLFTPNDRRHLLRDSVIALFTMAIFVYFGCLGVVATGTWLTSAGNSIGVARLLPIAFAFGLSVMVLVYTVAHLSGGHLNPAITLSLVILRRVSIGKALCYFVMQLIGACLGAALLWGSISGLAGANLEPSTPSVGVISNPPFFLGATVMNSAIHAGNGFLLEFMGTAFLILVVVQTAIDSHSVAGVQLPPIAIGFALVVIHIALVPFTGCGVNPARTFGPAIIVCIGTPHNCGAVIQSSWWIYWVGPFAASIVVAIITKYLHGGPGRYVPLELIQEAAAINMESGLNRSRVNLTTSHLSFTPARVGESVLKPPGESEASNQLRSRHPNGGAPSGGVDIETAFDRDEVSSISEV